MHSALDDAPIRSEPSSFPAPRNLLHVVWQRKWLVLLGLVLGLVVGYLVYARSQPIYRSSAQVLVIKKRTDLVPLAGGDPTQSYLEDYVSTHIALLRSHLVVDKAVKKANLAGLKTFEGQGNPTGEIIAGLSATRDGTGINRTIINLGFQGTQPEETGIILDAVIDSYTNFLEGAYHTVSRDTGALIVKARDLLKKDLAEQEQKHREFMEKGPLLLKGKDGVNPHLARIIEIETKRSALLIQKAEWQARLRALEQAKKSGKVDLALLAPPSSETREAPKRTEERSLEDQLVPLILEEQELLQDFAEEHPRVRSVRAKMAMIRRTLEREKAAALKGTKSREESKREASVVDRYIRSAQHELAQIDITQQELAGLLKAEREQAMAMRGHELTDEALRGDIARSQQLYEQTIKRLQEINLIRDFGGYDARTIAPPGIGIKVAPNLLRILILSAILGLLGGVGLAYLADITDRSFRNPEEIRRRLGLPVMGHLPYIPDLDRPSKKNGHEDSENGLSLALCVHARPTSMEAEAYRSLRTALYFATRGETHKVIQITSPNMADGKTTVVANLAVSIAQSGKRVVLVDADCRRPRLHRLFGVSATAGLTSLLAGEVDVEAAVQQTSIPGLAVLPCGTRPPNPAELLTAPAFERLLGDLRNQYDYVLVDTPPLLAVTDPCIVAGRVDGVLLAIRVSKNGRPAAERAKELLTNLGVKVMGIVVNGIGRESGSKAYGYRYYDSNEYRYEYGTVEPEVEQPSTNGQAAAH